MHNKRTKGNFVACTMSLHCKFVSGAYVEKKLSG